MADARIIIKPTSTGKFVALVEVGGVILASMVRPTREECEAWVRADHPDTFARVGVEHWAHPQRPTRW